MEEFEECTDETDEHPFTFPQVKPFYLSLRKVGRNVSTRKPLKPLKCFAGPESEEKAQNGNKNEDDSHPVNSHSRDPKTYRNNESWDMRKDHKGVNVNEKSVISEDYRGNLDIMTPCPMMLKTPFSCKSTSLVKRLPKNCFTPGNKINEEKDMRNVMATKLAQHSVDKTAKRNIFKDNGRQDVLCDENIGKSNNKNGRILKDILNYEHSTYTEKSVDAVKLTQDSKCTNRENRYVSIIPSISYQKGSNISEPQRSPKSACKMTPAIEIKRNNGSCVSKSRRGNLDRFEKPKHQLVLSKETDDDKHFEVERYNPSLSNHQVKSSALCINGIQYVLLSKLGQGGSSEVYQVLDKKTSTLLAVKCVNLGDADEVTAMGYMKEIEMLTKLQSSNRVIKLIDNEYLKHQQTLYVVMEKGDTDLSTLLKHMAKSGDVSLPMIIYYWTEMLHAVKEIHSHGIVHADLKPANFLLVCGRLKLIDFGIASAIQNDATSVSKCSMHGTCNYMSPEAIQDPSDSSKTKVGYKSDVWSLGCILYNLLYRKTPFQHITNNLQKLKVIADPKHRIEFPPVFKCPPPLMDALKSCLTYNARRRPTIAELIDTDYIWPASE